MPGRMDKLAVNKLIIMYLLYQMDMPLSTAQLVDFAAEGEYMDYFSCQQYIAQLLESRMLDMNLTEGGSRMYSITEDGEEVLRLFSKQIPYSVRSAVCDYVRKNKKRIKREFEVVANYFYNGRNDYIVKCGVYEDETALMEINISVVSKETAKQIKKNWKENVTVLYGKILSAMIDEKSGEDMEKELEQSFENSHVSTAYCDVDEE